jgi:hypothetical protein
MAAVVQSTCPGCKKTLQIPAEWLRRRIRCKHCGLVLNARTPMNAEQPRARASAAVNKPRQPEPAPKKAPASTKDIPIEVEPITPPPVAYIAREFPGYTTAQASPDSVFEGLVDDEGTLSSRRRRRHPNFAAAVVVFFFLLLLTGFGGAVYYLKFVYKPGEASVENNAEESDAHRSISLKDHGPAELGKESGDAREKGIPFPRRALLISLHNYLFANPVGAGMPTFGARNIAAFPDKLSNGLRIPRNQIAHLSDSASKGLSRPPLRRIVEETLTTFLESSRPQDRVMVFFVGHAAEVGDDAYLVPLEGELDRPETLIPLKWVWEKLANCPARQKVFVLDVCHLNPVIGAERPGGEVMGPKLAAALRSPPPGIQVWAACGPEQHSYETEDDPMGVFLDQMQTALERVSEGKLKLLDHIQRPDDLIPVAELKTAVDQLIEKQVKRSKLVQATMLSGTVAENGVRFDPNEPMPAAPKLAAAPAPLPANKRADLAKLIADVAVPPIKPSMHDAGVSFNQLPPFDDRKLEAYFAGPTEDTDLRKAVRKTQALLFAVAAVPPPPRLVEAVNEVRKTLRGNLSILREGYRAPANENQFKNQVLNDEKDVARIMSRLNHALEDMQAVAAKRDAEPVRWQANYDFMVARLEAEIAYLYEYQSMLGQMRKELPPRDADLHGGWKLAATTSLTGDSAGKKLASSSRKALDKIAKEHAGTPWEILAKREKLTALGLEWKPAQ